MEHIHKGIHGLVELPDNERIAAILKDNWVGYSKARSILTKLDDLLQHPRILRMPNLLIVGDTNNGKTQIVNRFYNLNRPDFDNMEGSLDIPVIYIEAPPKPVEKLLYAAILDKLFVPYRPNDRPEKLYQQVKMLLKKINTKILIIDEIHNILAANHTSQRVFLNVLKYLANELQIVIVGVGVHEALNVINSDPQLANRFDRVFLDKWQMGDEYLRLLASMEFLTPLKKPSDLTETTIALKLLSMSEGYIGELSKIIKLAAVQAVKTGAESITKQDLSKIDYISPSERKRKR